MTLLGVSVLPARSAPGDGELVVAAAGPSRAPVLPPPPTTVPDAHILAIAATLPPPTTVPPPPPTVRPRVVRPAAVAASVPRPTPTTVAWAPPPMPAPPDQSQEGRASWYRQAPAGTCAHRTLPLGTVVQVTNLANGRTTTCRVADRGPFVDGWIIDLSWATFSALAPPSTGVIDVRVEWRG